MNKGITKADLLAEENVNTAAGQTDTSLHFSTPVCRKSAAVHLGDFSEVWQASTCEVALFSSRGDKSIGILYFGKSTNN